MRYLGIDLRAKLVGRPAQLGQKLSRLARNLRQLLRPKDNQGQHKQEDGLGETHAPIIMRERKKQQCAGVTAERKLSALEVKSRPCTTFSRLSRPFIPLPTCSAISPRSGMALPIPWR